MFAITINQGGIIGALINQEQLDLPSGTPHFNINENEFDSLESLADHIKSLADGIKDTAVTWRYRVNTHNVDTDKLKSLLTERGIDITIIEAQQLQGPGTEV